MTVLYAPPFRFTASRPASALPTAIGTATTSLFTINGIIRLKSLFGIVGTAVTSGGSATVDVGLGILGVGESIPVALGDLATPQATPIPARSTLSVSDFAAGMLSFFTTESKVLMIPQSSIDSAPVALSSSPIVDVLFNGGTISVGYTIATATLTGGTMAWTLEYEAVSAGASVTIL